MAYIVKGQIPCLCSISRFPQKAHSISNPLPTMPYTQPLPGKRTVAEILAAHLTARRENKNVVHQDDYDSDTEIEDNAELEEHYLHQSDDSKRVVETIFGKGIKVWKSHEGTLHPHFEGELIDGEVVKPQRRRRQDGVPESFLGGKNSTTSLRVEPANGFTISLRHALPTPAPSPSPPPQPQPRAQRLRRRDPSELSTVFHYGSAAINPLGAHARPPPRLVPSLQQTPVHLAPAVEQPQRVVSGSFGTFEEQPSQFAERPYRLGPGSERRARQGVRAFERRPWLRK